MKFDAKAVAKPDDSVVSVSLLMSDANATPLTRRSFLKRGVMAAGAVALPCYIPASALGRDGAVAPSERIVMGGIGLGGRGSYDLGAMLTEPDVQWVAVCDVRKSRRDAAKNVVDTQIRHEGLRGVCRPAPVPGRADGCGRRVDCHRRPLARAGLDPGDAGGQGCLLREAGLSHHGAGAERSWRPPAGMAGFIKPAPSGSASRIMCLPSKWPAPAGWARFIPFMRTAVGATACVTTGCRRNPNRPRMKWTGTSGSVLLPGGPTTPVM